jgi:hypothetical protein
MVGVAGGSRHPAPGHFSYITTREEREQREQREHPMKWFTVETIYRLRPILAERMGTSQQPSYRDPAPSCMLILRASRRSPSSKFWVELMRAQPRRCPSSVHPRDMSARRQPSCCSTRPTRWRAGSACAETQPEKPDKQACPRPLDGGVF